MRITQLCPAVYVNYTTVGLSFVRLTREIKDMRNVYFIFQMFDFVLCHVYLDVEMKTRPTYCNLSVCEFGAELSV